MRTRAQHPQTKQSAVAADRSADLVLHVAQDSDPLRGSVRDAHGIQHPFTGWLGLMGVLEDQIHTHRAADDQPTPTGGHMITTSSTPLAPIALHRDEGEALWFLGVLATIKASAEATDGRVAVIEHLAPRGTGSPLHVHHNEDEWFYVIDGELAIWVSGRTITAPAGSFVYGPRDVPHTFAVSSEQARFLLVTEPAGFDAFMRAAAEPARSLTIPPADLPAPDPAKLAAIAASHGIEILGPPGIPA